FEGSSEIMRLFIAREAVDHHFKTAFALVDKESSKAEKAAAFSRVMKFYPTWYPARWLGKGQVPGSFGEFGKLAKHMRFAERHTRKLGRTIFHAMVRLGPKLERRQLVLFRAVDIGAELFAMAAACVRAQMLAKQGNKQAATLADLFCRAASKRVEALFQNFYGGYDGEMYKIAQQVMRGEHAWLETGIISLLDDEGHAAAPDEASGQLTGAGV
ncbi:MAG TPA: acyl-CoA dehydrogenase, partial [Casimicrobiaceae bacterium]